MLVVGAYPDADTFEWHILDSLRELGCTTQMFHSRKSVSGVFGLADKAWHKASTLLLREPERRIEAALLAAIDRFEPQLVLVVLGNQLSPKTLELVRRRTRARIVCWCQDQMTTIGRQFLLAGGYDAVFVKDWYMQALFSSMIRATEFHYLAEACNPRVHRPVAISAADRARYGCDLMIAGTLYYYRQEILREVLARLDSLQVKVWGSKPDWLLDRLPGRFMGQPVHNDEKARAIAAARICLNTLHYGEVSGLNCRAFELAGCGGFQMITHVPALAGHFEPEREIVSFTSVDELVEKADHYLKNPEQAAAIAERGRLRAHRDHTYEHRLVELLAISLR